MTNLTAAQLDELERLRLRQQVATQSQIHVAWQVAHCESIGIPAARVAAVINVSPSAVRSRRYRSRGEMKGSPR